MVRLGMAVAALALMASPLLAQESSEQLKKELQELRAEVDALKAVNTTKEIPSSSKAVEDAMAADDNPVMTLFKQTKLSGFVDAGYVVSFNQLHSDGTNGNNVGANPVRAFDDRGNSFYLNAVQLNLERLASKDMIVGYHIELAAGHDPLIYDQGAVAIQEGWAQILAPLGSGLDIRVGKMATLVGYEVVESVNNFNYSRGMLFNEIQPITHTGVRASYWLMEQFGLTLGFNNGTNANGFYADNDHGKMLELQVALKPMKDLSANFTLLWGNDTSAISTQAPAGNSAVDANFWLFDIVVAYQMDKLTLAMNVDFARAQQAIAPANGGGLSGFALYAKYQATDSFAGALRFEYYSDSDGLRGLGPNSGTGAARGTDSGTGARVIGLTVTGELKVAQQLILRFEIRHDSANNHVFTKGDSDGGSVNSRGDTTLGFEAIMPF